MSTALRPRLWQAVGIAAVSFGSQALADVSLPVIHRLAFDAAGVEAARQLPERVAIVPMNGAATAVLVGLLNATPATPPAAYPAGMALMLLSGGPLLDQPDQAAAHSLLREGFEFSLILDYTSVRAAGHQLERNLPWRPLVQAALPDLLPAGEYSVTVTWRAVDKLELPAPLPGRKSVQTIKFRVLAS